MCWTRWSEISSVEDAVMAIQAERLRELLRWRDYLPHLVEAVKSVLGGEVRVYIVGSAVEGKLTVDSDVDILVVVRQTPRAGLERARIIDEIWRIMESRGVPWWYPFEIQLLTEEELRMLEKGRLVGVL